MLRYLWPPLVMALVGCSTAAEGIPMLPVREETPSVTAIAPIKREWTEKVECVGVVRPESSVAVLPPVDGLLISISSYGKDGTRDFRDGDAVKQGDLLFLIAQHRPSYADWLVADGQKQQAERRLAELKATGAAGPSAVSQANEIREAGRAAQAQLEQLRPQLNIIEVRAPLSGVLGERRLANGNVVQADDAQPLVRVDATERMYVTFEIDEPALLRMLRAGSVISGRSLGQVVNIALADEESFSHTARVDFIYPEVNARSGTVTVRAVAENSKGLLRSGMSVRVELALAKPRSVLCVDPRALDRDSNGSFVWVVRNEETLDKVYVAPGEMLDKARMVQGLPSAGGKELSENDRYVLAPPRGLRSGMNVRLRMLDAADIADGPAVSP